jgi:hypothetical protein
MAQTAPSWSDRSRGAHPVALAPSDQALLGVIGRHPFLTIADLSAVLGWSIEWTRWRRNTLIRQGLVRLLTAEEVGDHAPAGPAELTASGLAVVAAFLGLTVADGVRYHGLAGGGPKRPVGSRRSLLRHLEHTLGVNAVFVSLYRTAQQLAAASSDDAMLEWRNAAACSRRHVRPDGYGIYRHAGVPHGFFLEYDRGTMNRRDYREKVVAYLEYRASRRFEQDYDGFPTILVITGDPGPEERIAKAIHAVSVGWGAHLPVLLTTRGRLAADRDGLLGPVWREPWGKTRRRWLFSAATGPGSPRAYPTHGLP